MLRLQPGAAHDHQDRCGRLSIKTIDQDPRGPVLVVRLNGRLFQVVRQTLIPLAPPPARWPAWAIRNVFRDSKGRLWIGTDGQGIAILRRRPVLLPRYTMKEGLVKNDFVRAFCEDREVASDSD